MKTARRRLWLHTLLFGLTLVSTTVVGARLAENFRNDAPAVDLSQELFSFTRIVTDPGSLLAGLPFSLTLLAILLAHELGHYFVCRYYRLDASLPYFLPSPTIIGTLGAFIRIRSPIYSKRVLFDVGIAGPIAGFVFLLPALAIGLAFSRIVPGLGAQGDLVFGTPAIFRLLEWIVFPSIPASDISLHPVARAAWVGVFATALNLLPIGQLDGGHILYSYVGDWHRALTRIFIAALLPIGIFFSYTWLVWAALLLLFGRRHPSLYDPTPLSRGRRLLGVLALVILLLSFSLTPVRLSDSV